jgi:chaperonin GroEL
MAQVRGALRQAGDAHQRSELQARLGRLSGGTAILRVGGIHDVERDARKALAERAVTGMRNAVSGGVVAGGGAALLAAQPSLSQQRVCDPGEALAFHMLARALEAPMRAIAHNAGRVPDVVIEHARAAGPGAGFDARDGRIVNMREARIFDSADTLCRALEIAVSGAVMALTTDVIVHHRNPVESIDP